MTRIIDTVSSLCQLISTVYVNKIIVDYLYLLQKMSYLDPMVTSEEPRETKGYCGHTAEPHGYNHSMKVAKENRKII